MSDLNLDIATMKITVLLTSLVVILFSKTVSPATIQAPLISLHGLSESDREYLNYLNKNYPRSKRSGSDAISALKATVGQGIKSKLGMIAKSSAYISGGSSGHNYHYDVPESYEQKAFDFWSLKKSILNTLLQAVKAIKGGVIAIKGQLIKGSGYLISAKGKLISAKGEAISTLGKNIASNALLSPHPHYGHSGPSVHEEYSHGPHHEHYHEPSDEYGSPSAPGPEIEIPDHYHHSPSHHQEEAGILIIKKIPHTGHDHSEHHELENFEQTHSKVPEFKPIKPSGPNFATIIGKFFSASTSLKPDEPTPFGYTLPGHDSYHESSHTAALQNYDHLSDASYIQSTKVTNSHDLPAPGNSDEFLNQNTPLLIEKENEKIRFSLNNSNVKVISSTPIYDEIRPLPTAFSNSGGGQISNYFSDTINVEESFPPYPELQYSAASDNTEIRDYPLHLNFSSKIPNLPKIRYLSSPSKSLPTFSQSGLSAYTSKPHFLQRPHKNHIRSSTTFNKHIMKNRPSINIIKSVGYQLGPDGPKRL